MLDGETAKAAPLSEQALMRIRQDILAGSLPASSQLKLDALTIYYGFSSSPIREALNRLVSEGLVINEDRRGFFVAPISIHDLEEITRLRCLLEPEALENSIKNGDDAWEANIIACYYRLERQEERLIDIGSFISDREWSSLHHEFHASLLAACEYEKLLQMRTTFFYQSERYWYLWANATPNPRNKGSNHDRLRDAVLDRNIERAKHLIRNHISQTTEIVVKYLQKL